MWLYPLMIYEVFTKTGFIRSTGISFRIAFQLVNHIGKDMAISRSRLHLLSFH